MRLQDPLIVGAGPAGCAAAIVLAREGARPVMLERLRTTGDALCGGFMSWETLKTLGALGIDDLGGHPIDRLRLFSGGRSAEARLPARAVGLSRRRLDTTMQRVARESGAEVRYGVAVRQIDGMTVQTDDGDVTADTVFAATGKHDLRGLGRQRKGDATLGLRVRIPPHPRLTVMMAGAIELHLFDRGYAGMLLQEDGSANLCLAVRKSRLSEAGGKPEELLAEVAQGTPLADRLAFMTLIADVGAIANIPYGWSTAVTEAGLFRLGDQAAVIPSLAGEGMGIAIASGVSAATRWNAQGPAASIAWQRDFARSARGPIAVARTLWERAEQPWSARLGIGVVNLLPGLANLLARATRIAPLDRL